MQEGKGLIGKLTTDQALADDFTQTIKSIRAIAERIEKGDSTVARLTRDKDLYQDLKKLLDDARETLRTVREQVSVGTFASVLLNAF
jgi:ABC-type Fe3+-citrate transport system substrate-binding protein